jgi:uncharacterized lipoprotein YddW (UPF0748 family)
LTSQFPLRVRLKRALPTALGGLLVSVLQTVGLGPPALAASQSVGVWLTNSPSPLYYNGSRLDRAVNELAAAGFTTLYPNVWSRGATFHRSRWAPMGRPSEGPDGDPLVRVRPDGAG